MAVIPRTTVAQSFLTRSAGCGAITNWLTRNEDLPCHNFVVDRPRREFAVSGGRLQTGRGFDGSRRCAERPGEEVSVEQPDFSRNGAGLLDLRSRAVRYG